MGLLVNKLDQAQQALTDHKIAVTDKSDHLEVSIDRADQMYEIARLLHQKGIDCGVADIVDQVYQG